MHTEIKFALVYVLSSFVWSCVEYVTGLESTYIHLHPYFVTPFYILLTIIIYLLAFREKRAALGGKITFRKLFMSGLILSFLILLFNPIQFYIFNNFINPHFFKDFALYNIESGKMEPDAANEYFTFNNMLIRGSLYRFIMGILAALIVSWFMRRNTMST